MVFVSEKRVAKLESVLVKYSDTLNESGVKDQIIEALKFEKPATSVKLYGEKSKIRARLIEELEAFFFVGEVYFYPKPKKTDLYGLMLISRFRSLFEVATNYNKNFNGRLHTFPNLSKFLYDKSFEEVAEHCSKERIKKLEKVLDDYRYIFTEGENREQIIRAFKSEKPVTSIEFCDIKAQVIKRFIEELKEFFLVGQVYFDPESPRTTFSGDVYVSRFKDLLNVMMYYAIKHNGMLDGFADLSGLLVGYSIKEVAQYCFKERLYNLIK